MEAFDQNLEEEIDAGVRHPEEQLEAEVKEEGPPRAVPVKTPKTPTREEHAEHSLHHAVYEPWCEHCVRARGREDRHGTVPIEKKTENVVSMDYGFVDDVGRNVNERGAAGTLLVTLDHDTVYCFSTMVRRKGRQDH